MKCPICDMDLEITDKWMPGLWMVRCPRYACNLPFYVQEKTRELALKTFLDAADAWRKNHEDIDRE